GSSLRETLLRDRAPGAVSESWVAIPKGYLRSLSFPWIRFHGGLSFQGSLCCSAFSLVLRKLATGTRCSSGFTLLLSDDPIRYSDTTRVLCFFTSGLRAPMRLGAFNYFFERCNSPWHLL